jgi:cation diffusion facilitator family transporter
MAEEHATEDHSTAHIIQSLTGNLIIAAGKGVAAVLTGSGSMIAETIHSFADCGNQLLLLLGVKRAKKPADKLHPLGYGRALYFWSFMVALLLFTGGGMFSIYEGLHKIREPEHVEKVWLGMIILGFSLLVEGWSLWGNIREMKKRRGAKPLLAYLRDTKDSDLVVVFGENFAAVVGLGFAFAALLLASETGDGRWDGIGSLAIGVVLVGVAGFLAFEIMSLLVGESADPDVAAAARQLADEHPKIDAVLHLITVQQGPGEVMVAAKIKPTMNQSAEELCETINEFERQLKLRCPEVRWSFIEPDVKA